MLLYVITCTQVVKIFLVFYGTQWYITVYIRTSHWVNLVHVLIRIISI
jgi:hypothetical protein